MSWLKVDDKFMDHPKIEGLTDRAFRMYMAGMVYCAAHETDGFVPKQHIKNRFGSRSLRTRLEELTNSSLPGASPLWHSCDGGWMVHNYLVRNPSKAELKQNREDAKNRMASVRANNPRTGGEQSANKSNGSQNVRLTPARPGPSPPEVLTEPSKPHTPSGDVALVFEHWRNLHGNSQSKLDRKRTRLIKTALANYSVDELKRVATNIKTSPHHQGENDQGRKYTSIDLLYRDADHIEKFRDIKPKRGVLVLSAASKSAGDDYAAKVALRKKAAEGATEAQQSASGQKAGKT